MLKQPHLPERRAPNYLVLLLAFCGVGGTGYGAVKANSADVQAGVSQREADRALAQRNRYEDLMNHCIERQIDAARGSKP